MTIKKLLNSLNQILPPEQLVTDKGACFSYSYDNASPQTIHRQPEDCLPDAIVYPKTHQEVISIVQACNQHEVSLVPRGRGTGTVGGSIPSQGGGLILSLEAMTKLLELDPENRFMRVQPGLTNQAVQTAAKEAGFFWAPDPSSGAFCSVGGNLAYNSAGPRAVKYGTTRDNTLGLLAVTGDGRELKTGTITSKSVVGYDLTRLLIGSEGTLAVITEATLKLLPLPETKLTMQASYKTLAGACQAVVAIMTQPHTPCALEFMDSNSLQAIRANTPDAPIELEANALLMIEVDGTQLSATAASEAIKIAAANSEQLSFKLAETNTQTTELWRMRKALSPSLRRLAPKKINEDVVVPVTRLPELILGVEELCKQHRMQHASFGHAGNGNIHVNLLPEDESEATLARAEKCLTGLFELTLKLGGSLSGEHGVGLAKANHLHLELDSTHLDLMHKIQAQFDPKGILNPGKLPGDRLC